MKRRKALLSEEDLLVKKEGDKARKVINKRRKSVSVEYAISAFHSPSNLTCKLVLVDVRIFSLSCKSCWEISVSCSQPSAMECNLLSSVDGTMLLHKCSGGPSSPKPIMIGINTYHLASAPRVLHFSAVH